MTKWFEPSMLKAFEQVYSQMQDNRQNLQAILTLEQIGTVQSVTSDMAMVIGLSGVNNEELLQFPKGIYGSVLNSDNDKLLVVLLGDHSQIEAGDEVRRTKNILNRTTIDHYLG